MWNYLPLEIQKHVIRQSTSYERSRMCVVSTTFNEMCVEVSKELSMYPRYYEDLNAIAEFRNQEVLMYTTSTFKKVRCSRPNIYDIIRSIFNNRDYHLVVRTKISLFVDRLEDACRSAFVPMVELCLKYGHENIIRGFEGACKSGDLSIVKMMFNKYDVVECYRFYMNEKNEKNEIDYLTLKEVWYHLYYCAGIGGNIEIVNFIRDYEIGNNKEKYCLGGCCANTTHTNIRDQLNENSKKFFTDTTFDEWMADYTFTGACSGGHLDLVKWAVEKGTIDFDEGFSDACEKGYLHIVEYLLSLDNFAVNIDECLGEGLCNAFRNNCIDIVESVIEWRGKIDDLDTLAWSFFLQAACEGEHQYLINLAVKYGATKCECCYQSVQSHVKDITGN